MGGSYHEKNALHTRKGVENKKNQNVPLRGWKGFATRGTELKIRRSKRKDKLEKVTLENQMGKRGLIVAPGGWT